LEIVAVKITVDEKVENVKHWEWKYAKLSHYSTINNPSIS